MKVPEVTKGLVVESITPDPNKAGLLVVAYTTPLAVTGEPPSEVILPPILAPESDTLVAAMFNAVGATAEELVVNVLSAP